MIDECISCHGLPQAERLRSGERYLARLANETRFGVAVPSSSAADERVRRTWPAVRATVSRGTSGLARAVRAASRVALVLLRRTSGPLSLGPRRVWQARPRQRSSTVRPSRASSACACEYSRSIVRRPASVADRARALSLSAEDALRGSPAEQGPECGSIRLRQQNTNSGAVIGLTPPIEAGVAWRRAPPSRPASRPQGLTEIAQETASRIEQLGQKAGIVGGDRSTERA